MKVKIYDVELKEDYIKRWDGVLSMMSYFYLCETEEGKTFLTYGEGYSQIPISWEDVKRAKFILEEEWEEV